MNTWIHELRYAGRQLRRSPGFALTAVITLAFGMGATVAIFSIVEGVLLRPLPFPQQDRLLIVGNVPEGVDTKGAPPNLTGPGVLAYARDTHVFESIGAFQQTAFELSGISEPAQVNAARMTAGMFDVLRLTPVMGRTFTRQEDESSQQVAVIGYQMWNSRFHRDPHVLGATILLDRKPYQVIGVMPREFEFPLVPGQLNRSELWVPMSLTQSEIVNGAGSWNFRMVGRLKAGISDQQALQDLGPAAAEIEHSFPPAMGSLHIHPRVMSLTEATVGEARPMVRMLFFAVTIVLFIACANLAGLLLVRVIRRRRETSVRLALGASARTILRQSIMEAMILSLSGGSLGVIAAGVALKFGINLLPESLPRVSAIGLDWRVAGFAVLLVSLTGLFCGLVPAFAAVRTNMNDALKEGGRTGSSGSGHARLRSALVVGELAVALILLAGSGLLLRSFARMREVDLGFRSDHALTASYGLPQKQYSTQSSVDVFDKQLMEKLRRLPGVEAVGVTTLLPEGSGNSDTAFVPEGYIPPKGAGLNLAWPSQVFGDYFQAAGISLLRGRTFHESDNATSPLVVIVNRTLAERYWPGQNPIGKRIHIGVPESPTPWMTVVGEIVDIKQSSADAETLNQFYTPASQYKADLGQFAPADMLTGSFGSIVLRGAMAPERMIASLQSVVRSIDPQLPLVQVQSMDEVIAENQASRRFNTILISSFAAAAVLLALLGIYSVIAFSAVLRSHELAIRLALGSRRGAVLRLVVGSGAKLGAAGSVLGIAGALLATRLLRTMLFEVSTLDPLVLALSTACVFLLAIAASVIPASRAAAIEPMQALRNE